MTAVDQEMGGRRAGPVVRTTALAGLVASVGTLLATWAEAHGSGDDQDLAMDTVAIGAFTVAGLVLLALLDVWALRGGQLRTRRAVVGLAVAAVLALPLLWWNPVPVMAATSALALGHGLGRERFPRAAHVTAVLVIAIVVALWVGSTLAGLL
jgi:hypothetical protein